MTTTEEALKHALNPSKVDTLLIKAAVNDPMIQVWPEIDGLQKGVLVASSSIMEVLNLVCSHDGNIDAEAALAAIGAARDHIIAACPHMTDESIKVHTEEGEKAAQTFREKMATFANAEPGDVIGQLRVGAHEIPIKKDPRKKG